MREKMRFWWTRDLDDLDFKALLHALEFWYMEVVGENFGKEAKELYGKEVIDSGKDVLEALREEYEARFGGLR